MVEEEGVLAHAIVHRLQVVKELHVPIGWNGRRCLVQCLKVYPSEEGMLLQLSE